ncbi:hypothetical protein [Nonomuraea insulae]|uniref:Uncharacterized protein n=1 Tax=Nonomuraea insulae TaxID=1616787 RepID=A0ABW1D159_9ACTN
MRFPSLGKSWGGKLLFVLLSGVLSGLGAGLLGALVVGRHHAWLVCRLTLLAQRRLPRRLIPFLDDMHRLGLLRAVGSLYQFRHAELHDHLAAPAAQHTVKSA